eukprot:gene14097-biopygen20082
MPPFLLFPLFKCMSQCSLLLVNRGSIRSKMQGGGESVDRPEEQENAAAHRRRHSNTNYCYSDHRRLPSLSPLPTAATVTLIIVANRDNYSHRRTPLEVPEYSNMSKMNR